MISEQVRERIRDEWADTAVANWVIEQLPLLDLATHPARPILQLSDVQPPPPLRSVKKLVLSGGLEGTAGHVAAMKFAHETRALMEDDSIDGFPIFALLEPDSYIGKKGRKPLVTQPERAKLWATSGLVDGVVLLPDRDQDPSPALRYPKIHELLAPALWLTTGDNPAMVEILRRGLTTAIDIGDIIPRTIDKPHATFLSNTKSMRKDEVRTALFEHIALQYTQKYRHSFHILSADTYLDIVKTVVDELAEGL